MTMPGWSFVLALKSLQNAIILTPCWPSAGPTGGAGLAAPAGICSLICVLTFLGGILEFLHLQEIEFHGGRTAENRDHHFQFPAFFVHFFDNPDKMAERPIN